MKADTHLINPPYAPSMWG